MWTPSLRAFGHIVVGQDGIISHDQSHALQRMETKAMPCSAWNSPAGPKQLDAFHHALPYLLGNSPRSGRPN